MTSEPFEFIAIETLGSRSRAGVLQSHLFSMLPQRVSALSALDACTVEAYVSLLAAKGKNLYFIDWGFLE